MGYYAVSIGSNRRLGGDLCFHVQCLYSPTDLEDGGTELIPNAGNFS